MDVTMLCVEIIAHRGASHDAPENTLAAVRLAWAEGADAVEVDVHLTADGRLAVIHDPDTRRTTNADRLVREMTLAELERLDAGSWKSRGFAGERVPALDAVLALAPTGKRVFVEIKSGADAVPELGRCLARSGLSPTRVAVMAFDLATAAQAKRQLPRCEVCWLVERDSAEGRLAREDILGRACEAKLDGLDLEAAMIDAAWVKQTRVFGFKLHVWTVDDAPLARRLAEAGVDGITTNRPGWLREQLRM